MNKKIFLICRGYLCRVFTIVCFLSASLIFLGQYISPINLPFFEWLVLLFPVIVVSNVFFLSTWLIERRFRWAIVSLVALLLNVPFCPRIFQFPWKCEVEGVRDDDSSISLCTYNVRSFQMDYGGSSLDVISDMIETRNIDLLCLQEVLSSLDRTSLKRAFPYMTYQAVADADSSEFKVVVLSRFPISHIQRISFPERPNCALLVNLSIRGKSVRLLTCHLQTTNWNQAKTGLRYFKNDFADVFDNLFYIKDIIARNSAYRISQVNNLHKIIEQSAEPIIICGDFNDTPVSYAYETMRGNLSDAFCERGRGYGFTYRYLHKFFRIDYVFSSPSDFETQSYDSPDVEYSDHNPVFVRLKLRSPIR